MTPREPDPRIWPIIAETGLGPEVFNPAQHRSCVLVEEYVLRLVVEIVTRLELPPLLDRPQTAAALLDARGLVPAFAASLRWLLDLLEAEGLLRAAGDGAGRHWTRTASLPASDLDEARAAALASDPSYAPTYALLDEAAALMPRVARGEISAERALAGRVALWVAYFSNANGFYALTNHVAAHAVMARMPPHPAAVLEVGAGLGSGTEALLARLPAARAGAALASYRMTEPVPFFRRRGERTVRATHPAAPLTVAALDVNEPWGPQGIAPGSQDVVWGVNVFHVARRLEATLAEARAALVPGGWLVIGEGLRPFPRRPVGAELPFQLLEGYLDVEIDPVVRPMAGFLTAEGWIAALARAGFETITLEPDAVRLRALVPGFLAAAVAGRRPA